MLGQMISSMEVPHASNHFDLYIDGTDAVVTEK